MDNQSNRSDGNFDFGSELDQSKVSIVNLLKIKKKLLSIKELQTIQGLMTKLSLI